MANDTRLAGTRRKSLTTMMVALLAGSIAATAGGAAYAKSDGPVDPAKFQQRIEKRVDKALGSTDASSKRFTQALVDAGNVLNAAQRQAFFKSWNERRGHRG